MAQIDTEQSRPGLVQTIVDNITTYAVARPIKSLIIGIGGIVASVGGAHVLNEVVGKPLNTESELHAAAALTIAVIGVVLNILGDRHRRLYPGTEPFERPR